MNSILRLSRKKYTNYNEEKNIWFLTNEFPNTTEHFYGEVISFTEQLQYLRRSPLEKLIFALSI